MLTINHYQSVDYSSQRSTSAQIETIDDPDALPPASTSDFAPHVWTTYIPDEDIFTTLPILNLSLTPDNSCHHDSGANRHVFHNCDTFHTYDTIMPLTVKGFGHNLSTLAIGQGTIHLKAHYGDRTSPITLHNVLHIPAARSNLISGILLDKAGIICTLGNNSISLSINGQTIVDGHIINNMY